ncbi:MAG: prephenate dehydrogenase/arogenate dehydrogenase family protein, partial [Kiritimatiellae bacterium]|nr:prephenate dehydrogenase/arogenate dehydrogenase family protein [Kiritimatiellia bacterium]
SFADMSRVATMDAETWSDLVLENREHLLESVDRFAGEIATFRSLLARSDKAGLMVWIQKGADTKRSLQ